MQTTMTNAENSPAPCVKGDLGTIEVTVFDHAMDKDPSHHPLREVADAIRDGIVASRIALIRSITNGESLDEVKAADLKRAFDELHSISDPSKRAHLRKILADFSSELEGARGNVVRALKTTLPVVIFSGTFSGRGANTLKKHGGLMVLDFDDVEELTTRIELLAQDPYAVLVFVSPSGSGIKLVIRVPECDANTHKRDFFPAVERYYKERYDLVADRVCSDVSRCCFLSHDPDIRVDYDADIFPAEFRTGDAPSEYQGHKLASESEPPELHPKEEGRLTSAQIRELLSKIPRRPSYDEWTSIIGAVASQLPEEEGIPLLKEWSPEECPGEYAEKWAHAKSHVTAGTLFYHARSNGWSPSTEFKMDGRTVSKAARDGLREWLRTRLYNPDKVPPAPQPRVFLKGIPICTPGNLTSIYSQAKTGKTAFVGALVAAAINAGRSPQVLAGVEQAGSGSPRDTLGLTTSDPAGQVVLHFDTEQSPFDHHKMIRTAQRRADGVPLPPWFRSYRLAGCDSEHLRNSLELLLEEIGGQGGVFAVLVDGIADFVSSVNEESECNGLISSLMKIAANYNCPVICVLHENVAQKNGKQRGHLGSQLERKAETNLRLSRDGKITNVYAEKTRGAPIYEKDGHCFEWDNCVGMHLSTGLSPKTKKEKKDDDLRRLAEECFDGDVVSLKHKELVQRIIPAIKCSKSTAEKRVKAMTEQGFVQHEGKTYWLTPKEKADIAPVVPDGGVDLPAIAFQTNETLPSLPSNPPL